MKHYQSGFRYAGILFLTGLVVLVCSTTPLLAQERSFLMQNRMYGGGIGLGSVIAIVASWSRNKSVLWALIHGFCSWLYVIYYIITR